jgi:hypothetical protein
MSPAIPCEKLVVQAATSAVKADQRVTNGRQPPVNEVGISVALTPQDLLVGPRLPEVLGPLFEQFNKIEVVPIYRMPVEYPSPQESLPQGAAPRLEFIPAGGMEPRYWLISEDDVFVIQVQRDYLAFNWRRRESAQEYVRYDTIKEKFIELLNTVQSALNARGGQLLPERAELTYIDVIAPNTVWRSPSDTHRLISMSFADSEDYEQIALSYSKALYVSEGPWSGRLHVTLNPVFDWLKEESRLSLNMTARSGNFSKPNTESVLSFLDMAHDEINHSFLRMLTAEARQIWGL